MYIYRCNEAITTTHKKLDLIMKNLFPPGRKSLNPIEVPIEPFVDIVYFVAMRHSDYAIKNVLYYLLNIDGNLSNVDNIAPERASIALKVFILMLNAPEDAKPPFPQSTEPLPSGIQEASAALSKGRSGNVLARYPEAREKINAYLGKLVKILHQSFGSFLLLDDKFTRPGTATGASSGTYSTAGEISNVLSKEKQPYYDLMKVWIASLPELMPNGEERDIYDMVCKYTAHVDPDLGTVAQDALLRLCRHCPSKQINILRSFGQFLFSIPDRPSDILEKSLKLYIDLLDIWLADVGSAASDERSDSTSNHDPLLLWGKMQELETIGLLFLTSASPKIRHYSLKVLAFAATLFDRYLRKRDIMDAEGSHIMSVIHSFGPELVDVFRNDYTNIVEAISKNTFEPGFLVDIAQSDASPEIHFWSKAFAGVIKKCFEKCPTVVHSCAEHIYQRLNALHGAVVAASDPTKGQNATLTSKFSLRSTLPATDEIIDQWKYYILFAFASETTSEPTTKKSYFRRNITPAAKMPGRGMTAQELFRLALPLLTSDKSSIRVAVVLALGHTNWAVFRDLIEEMQPYIKNVVEDMRARYMRGSQKRTKKLERMRAELTHVFLLSTDYVKEKDYLGDENLVTFMLNYIRELGAFLSDAEVQMEWDHQMLRYYFCGFVERFYQNIASRVPVPDDIVPFDLRYSLFKLIEEWCGYGQRGNMMREREAKMTLNVLEQVKDPRERSALTAAMEEQRKALEYASLRAMAALCKGKLIPPDRIMFGAAFNIRSLFEWIDSIFNSKDERLQPIARTALESLLLFNQRESDLWEDVILSCYQGISSLGTTQGYFLSLVEILAKVDYPCEPAMLINLILFKLGDPNYEIRKSAIYLLEIIGSRFLKGSFTNDFEVAILSPLFATYKQGQLLISGILARDYPTMTHVFLSQAFHRLETVNKDGKQNMLSYVLPWLETVYLEHSTDGARAQEKQLSGLLLNNLMYITIQHGDELEREIQSVWSRLVSNVGNVDVLVHFLIDLCIEKKSIILAAHAKKIIVYLGRTVAFARLTELLMYEISPKSLVPSKLPFSWPLDMVDTTRFYIAPLDELTLDMTRKFNFSKGQLITLFMVDFAIEKGKDMAEHLPLLLHLIFVQLDHSNPNIRDQSRHLLISLLHAFGERTSQGDKDEAKRLIQKLSDKNFHLRREELDAEKRKILAMSSDLKTVLLDSIRFFETTTLDFRQHWGEIAVRWATACPVRHVACRSLQIFRVLEPVFNQRILSELLIRLSNTIADPSTDVQEFVVEILVTLEEIVARMDAAKLILFPQLYWACFACLNTCHEDEFEHSLNMMAHMVDRLNLDDYSVQSILSANVPHSWDMKETLLQSYLGRGLSSKRSAPKALSILQKLAYLRSDILIENSDRRWIFLMLYFVPVVALTLSKWNGTDAKQSVDIKSVCALLATKLSDMQLHSFSRLFDSFLKGRFRSRDDFLKPFSVLLRESFFKHHAVEILSFLLQLLNNKQYQEIALELLCHLASNMKREEATSLGIRPESLRPLFQLFRTPHFEGALGLLDNFMRVFSEHNDAKFLFGNRAIQRIATEPAPPGPMNDLGWPFDDSEMKATRFLLSKLVNAFYSGTFSAEECPDTAETLFTADTWNESLRDVTESTEMLDGNYEDLVTQLARLEDFFHGDDVPLQVYTAGIAAQQGEMESGPSSARSADVSASFAQLSGPSVSDLQAAPPPSTTSHTYDDDMYSSEEEPSNGEEDGDDSAAEDTFALESFLRNDAATRGRQGAG